MAEPSRVRFDIETSDLIADQRSTLLIRMRPIPLSGHSVEALQCDGEEVDKPVVEALAVSMFMCLFALFGFA